MVIRILFLHHTATKTAIFRHYSYFFRHSIMMMLLFDPILLFPSEELFMYKFEQWKKKKLIKIKSLTFLTIKNIHSILFKKKKKKNHIQTVLIERQSSLIDINEFWSFASKIFIFWFYFACREYLPVDEFIIWTGKC